MSSLAQRLKPLDTDQKGGGTLTFRQDQPLPPGPIFLVFEGKYQRHITIATSCLGDTVIKSVIPAHGDSETVHLTIYSLHGDDLSAIATTSFCFYFDSAYYLAEFLVESVYNISALDDLELIRSENFDLSNELLDTLDDRLHAALKYLNIPDWWHMLGPSSPRVFTDQPSRETLLHFSARLGLYKVTSFLLDKPGSIEAVRIPNRHGYLPQDLAEEEGYTQLANLLREYNPHFVKIGREPEVTVYGVISHLDNDVSTFSTVAQRPIVEDIQIFEDLLRSREIMDMPNQRMAETDWPGEETQESQNVFEEHGRNRMEVIVQKTKDIQVVMDTMGQYDLDPSSYNTDGSSRSHQEHADEQQSADRGNENTELKGNIYDSAISGVHDFSQQLFRLRDYHRRKLLDQDVRKENLSRFSNSCPSLEEEGQTFLQLPTPSEEERHSSMLNLINDAERQAVESNPDTEEPQFTVVHCQDANDQPSIQICVNGVTLEGSQDGLDHSLNNFLKDYYGGNTPGVRRRSWAPPSNSLLVKEEFKSERNAPFSGKSSSLTSLDNEESDEGVYYHDAREAPSSNLTAEGFREGKVPSLSLQDLESPHDRVGSNMFRDDLPSDTLAKTLINIKQELVTPRDQLNPSQEGEPSSGLSGESADEEMVSTLAVPHSNMTKSLSTPSIPAAVSPCMYWYTCSKIIHDMPSYLLIQKLIAEHDAQFRRQHEVEEDDDENTNRLQGLQDCKSRRKSELSLLDFLNESANYPEDHSKNIRKETKDEKKRKTSVFSRFQSSYRTKKHKEKDTKGRNSHQYVSVSISNSTTCDVCQKTMANKPALRCENCLINVHEHTCKEQITLCDRNRKVRVPQRVQSEGTALYNAALRDKQGTSSVSPMSCQDSDMGTFEGVSGLRPTQSFKEKRSVSAPLRSQVTAAPISASGLSYPSNPLSAIPDFSEPDESQGGQSAAQLLHRRSLPTQSKAINEEGETDSYGSGPDLGPSNLGDTGTISESLESLDDVDGTTVEIRPHDDEDFQMLQVEEPETWSESVDKKVLKKLNAKDVKRQDTIWELIQTERHHCRTLKILQRLYSQGILMDLQMPREVVDKLFPKLDDLIQVHMDFIHDLLALQRRRPDRSIEHIGQTLVHQFEGERAEKMKYAYGAFCCGQKESVSFYKELVNKDRKFNNFIKRCNNYSLCQKREIPDFLLLVTQRPSKYLTLIEAILKRTQDKKDRENISISLQRSKDLLQWIDDRVHENEMKQRLREIYQKMDAKAATVYKGRKFKKSDIFSNNRKLIHEGMIGLKSARGKVVEAIAVLLTDLIFFVQEANGKYNFFSQDNKSCVIPLSELLVREKSDTRDSRGIYLFSQNKQSPEMYEVVCNTPNDRQVWLQKLRMAAEHCPTDEAEEAPQQQDDEDQRREMEERSARIKELIEQLHQKDQRIKECCEEKNRLMEELFELSSDKGSSNERRPDSMSEEGVEHMDVLQAAIKEVSVTASRLTTMLQNNNGNHLSRHVSSVGEHVSSSYHTPPVPKRAETFHGFDSSHDMPKGVLAKRLTEQMPEGEQWATPVRHYDRNDSDSEFSSNTTDMSPYQQNIEHDDSIEGTYYGQYSSGNDSMADVSGSESNAMMFQGENLTSISQLARSLHSIVHLTAKQGTAVETLRAQLAEANERINKLSAEVHDKKGGYRHHQTHHQLEELRNLSERVLKQRQDLEKQKERDREQIEWERSVLEEEKKDFQRQMADFTAKKEELKREKERFQKQIDMWEKDKGISHKDHDPTLTKTVSSPGMVQLRDHSSGNESTDYSDKSSPNLNNHRRSASADFCQAIENDLEKIRSGQMKSLRRELPTRPEQKTLQNTPSFSSSITAKLGGGQKPLPMHLLSAKNEQKTGIKAKQQIPSSFGQQVLPLRLSGSSVSTSDKPVSGGSSINSAVNSNTSGHMTGSQSSANLPSVKSLSKLVSPQQSKSSSTSSLSGVLKLAEPGGKGRSSSLTSHTPPTSASTDKGQGQKSASMDAGNSYPGNSQEKKKSRKGDNSDIYKPLTKPEKRAGNNSNDTKQGRDRGTEHVHIAVGCIKVCEDMSE
ncbi:hypothetical protein FSP39_024733 [Pinctada imbricata]|uniref:Rho guanine nucleotide exchange factor 28 n=1 Tax=Pinctada imbricata TaxID=66713 RepID=A0AA88Y6P0_PINIB|nr:hypothetical protein FSP39_024733 [Pinctada imbricata]